MSAPRRWLANGVLRLLGVLGRRKLPPIGDEKLSRIVVLRFGGIGDTVAVTALLAALRHHYPEARIELATAPTCVPLLEGNGDVDAVHGYSPLFATWNLFAWRRRYRVIRTLARPRIDALICTHNALAAILACFAWRARYVVGFDTDERGFAVAMTHACSVYTPAHPDWDSHREHRLSDQFVGLLATLRGAPVGEFAPQLTLHAGERVTARRRTGGGEDGPVIALLPGGTDPGKLWPMLHFATLARRLAARQGARTLVIGGADVAAEATPFSGVPRLQDFAGRLDLRASMALLGEADLVIGNDTGLMHAAVALGRPTLGLFGPTAPGIYGHASPRNRILRAPDGAPIAALEVTAVHAAAAEMLEAVGESA